MRVSTIALALSCNMAAATELTNFWAWNPAKETWDIMSGPFTTEYCEKLKNLPEPAERHTMCSPTQPTIVMPPVPMAYSWYWDPQAKQWATLGQLQAADECKWVLGTCPASRWGKTVSLDMTNDGFRS